MLEVTILQTEGVSVWTGARNDGFGFPYGLDILNRCFQ